MLQTIHNKIQGWFAGLIVVIISLSFVAWGISYYLTGSGAHGKVLAKVGHIKITTQDVHRGYSMMSRRLLQKTGKPLTLPQQQQLRTQVLHQLVQQAKLFVAANDAGFYFSPAMVTQLVMQMPAFKENGQFSPERYAQLLSANGISPEKFQTQIARQQVIGQVRAGIAGTSFVLPGEVNAFYKRVHEKRSATQWTIQAAKQPVTVTASQAQAFYKAHPQLFTAPERVSIQYILLSPNGLKGQVHVTSQQAKAYYDANASNYKSSKSWQVQDLLVKAPRGSTQDQIGLARAHVNGLVKKLENGIPLSQLGRVKTRWINAANASDAFLTVLQAMKPGQLSVPFQDRDGFHVIQLIKVKPGVQQPFGKVREHIMQGMRAQQLQALLSKQADRLQNMTYTNATTLTPAAKALGLRVESTPLFTRSGTPKGLASNPLIVQAAFGAEVLGGNNSSVITLKNGSLAVLRVKQHEVSHVKSFAEVKAGLMTQLRKQAQARAVHAKLQRLLAVTQGKSAAAGKKAMLAQIKAMRLPGRNWVSVTHLTKGVPALVSAHIFAMTKQHPFAAFSMPNADVLLLMLNKVIQPKSVKLTALQRQGLAMLVQNMHARASYTSYGDSVLMADRNYNAVPAAFLQAEK